MEGQEGEKSSPDIVQVLLDDQTTGDGEDNGITVSTDSQKKTRSLIYSHFSLDPKTDRWNCKYCRSSYKKPAGGGTGSLHNHLNKSHPGKLTQTTQKKITDHLQKVETENHVPKLSQEDFCEKLTKFVVCGDQPFSIVEDEVFKDLINSIKDPKVELSIPGRKKMRSLISDRYITLKNRIKELLQNCESRLNFVIDCWSSANGHSFQGVIVSWISNEWSIITAVLDLTRVKGPHSGDNLAEHFMRIIDSYGIYPKLLTITTDNASNMGSLFRRLDEIVSDRNSGVENPHEGTSTETDDKDPNFAHPKSSFSSNDHRISCLAHIINLSCKAILNELEGPTSADSDLDSEDEDSAENRPPTTISKLRKTVKKIRNSQDKRDWLRGQCNIAKIKANELILDMKIRWNSTLNMIERALELQGPLNLITSNFPELSKLRLSKEEWEQLEDMKMILLPFRDATLLFSRNAPMLSRTLHNYEILFAHLESYLPVDKATTSYRKSKTSTADAPAPNWLNCAALAGWKKLKKYYPSADGLAYKVATDPTRKDKWYSAVGWNQEWIKSCRADVRKLWNSAYKHKDADNNDATGSEPPTKKVKNTVEERMIQQMMNIPRGTPEDELTRYLREPVAQADTDMLKWWKQNEGTYPKLSKMAKDFLSIFGTGVPVERLFSDATDTLTHRRYRLSADSINECLCLKSWYKVEMGESLHNQLAGALKEMILGDSIEALGEEDANLH